MNSIQAKVEERMQLQQRIREDLNTIQQQHQHQHQQQQHDFVRSSFILYTNRATQKKVRPIFGISMRTSH